MGSLQLINNSSHVVSRCQTYELEEGIDLLGDAFSDQLQFLGGDVAEFVLLPGLHLARFAGGGLLE